MATMTCGGRALSAERAGATSAGVCRVEDWIFTHSKFVPFEVAGWVLKINVVPGRLELSGVVNTVAMSVTTGSSEDTNVTRRGTVAGSSTPVVWKLTKRWAFTQGSICLSSVTTGAANARGSPSMWHMRSSSVRFASRKSALPVLMKNTGAAAVAALGPSG